MRPAAQYPESAQPLGAQSVGVGRGQRRAAATGQLSSADADTRLAGALALIELADEWLTTPAADQITSKHPNPNQPVQEAQAIIHELCAYIRSPFPLVSEYRRLAGSAHTDPQAHLKMQQIRDELSPEARVRERILAEVSARVSRLGAAGDGPASGPWSWLVFDFSGAVFFYPVRLAGCYWAQPLNFSECSFCEEVDVSGSVFAQDADFSAYEYHSSADFRDIHCRGAAVFSYCDFYGHAVFTGARYDAQADFDGITCHAAADFSRCLYRGAANFLTSTYVGPADFSGSTYLADAHFGDSVYYNRVDFSRCVYRGPAIFSHSLYEGPVRRERCLYDQDADFQACVYRSTVAASHSTYGGSANFSGSVWVDETS